MTVARAERPTLAAPPPATSVRAANVVADGTAVADVQARSAPADVGDGDLVLRSALTARPTPAEPAPVPAPAEPAPNSTPAEPAPAPSAPPDDGLADLHRRYAATRDPALASALVDRYAGYAAALARRLHRGREPLDDLVQVAMEGLMLALRRYDPDRGVPFPGFAAPTIIGTIRRFFRDSGYAVHVPRPAHDIAGPARDAADRLAQELGRPATVAEVAADLGTSEDHLLTQLSALDARRAVSLDAPMAGSDEAFGASVGGVDPALRRAEDLVALSQGLAVLDDRDRLVLDLYYGREMTQSDIAARLGVSQVQVSRWIGSAVRRLRTRLVA